MKASDLLPAVATLLDGGAEQSTREVLDVRLTHTRSDELDESWRADKYRASHEDLAGVVPIDIDLRDHDSGRTETLNAILKIRGEDGMGRTSLAGWLEQSGVQLSRPLRAYPTLVEFMIAGPREIAAYDLITDAPDARAFLPQLYGTHRDSDAGEYLLLIERLADPRLMDSANDVSGWGRRDVENVLHALGSVHAVGLVEPHSVTDGPWPQHATRTSSVVGDAELFHALLDACHTHLPEVVTDDVVTLNRHLIDTLERWYPDKDELPRTLAHNDFNPRNVCLRPDGTPFIYDWELAQPDIPQRDLVEFLTFVLDPSTDLETVRALADIHRVSLQHHSGVDLDAGAWWDGVRTQIRYEAVNRLAWQWIFGICIPELEYVPRITATVTALNKQL